MQALQITNDVAAVCPAHPEGRADYKILNGTYYHVETPDAVVYALERARLDKERIRIFLGDAVTGEAWADEYDVTGTVSRSCGRIKIPLLVKNNRSLGGGGILDHCVVAILGKTQRFLYKHASFSAGRWDVRASELAGYVAEVLHNGEIHARFKKTGQAERYAAFMKGERLAK